MSVSRELIATIVSGRDPVGAAERLPDGDVRTVTWSRSPVPEDWLVDSESEGTVAAHAAAHANGRPSEARVVYGAARTPDAVAERLLALGDLAAETGLLRAIVLAPEGGSADRPASWGYEDLSVVVAARLAAPDVPWIRPDWRMLGRHVCQVAVAFGATDWQMPADDPADPEALAEAVGARAVAR